MRRGNGISEGCKIFIGIQMVEMLLVFVFFFLSFFYTISMLHRGKTSAGSLIGGRSRYGTLSVLVSGGENWQRSIPMNRLFAPKCHTEIVHSFSFFFSILLHSLALIPAYTHPLFTFIFLNPLFVRPCQRLNSINSIIPYVNFR